MLGMYRGPTKSNFDDVAQKNFLDGVQPVPIRTVPFYDDILQACDICPAFEDKKTLLCASTRIQTPHSRFICIVCRALQFCSALGH
jgi:hypothetical protein